MFSEICYNVGQYTLALINTAMPQIKRHFLTAILIVALGSVATFAFALPGPTACLVVGVVNLHILSDDSLTDSASEVDQKRYVQITRGARARIESTFGEPESKPVLLYFTRPSGFGPFKLSSYGSTQFIGSRACVMIGPKGQNVDVVAHELMHAELSQRVGYLKRFLQVPTWFDEGVAMQVDYRSRYTLSPQDANNVGYVRELTTFSSFFSGKEQAVVRNYAAAKQVVASWMAMVGGKTLYARLLRLKIGESFPEIFAE